MWVLSPGEPYPGREFLSRSGAFPGQAIPRARVPFRPDDMCILDLCIIYAALSANSQEMFSTCDCV